MNTTEFGNWLNKHQASFPGVANWLRDNPATVEAWREVLNDVDVSAALAATRLMNLGDEPIPPGYGDHARFVRRVANKLAYERKEERRQYIDGEEAFDCGHCRDLGYVEVINIWRSPRGSRPLKAFWEKRTRYLPTCMVPCTCSAALPDPKPPRQGPDRFNPDTMLVYDPRVPTEELAQEFEKWWSEGRHLGNRESAFDEFNQGVAS